MISLPLADLILSTNRGGGGKLAPWASLLDLPLRAYMYLHGGGGPQVSEVTSLGGVTHLSITSYRGHLTYHVNVIKLK